MRIMLTALAIVATNPAIAEECPAIENDLDRLACYDLEAGLTPTATESETQTSENGAWDVEIKKSEFKDTTDVYLRIASEKPLLCGYNPSEAVLMARCKENTTSFVISTDCYLTSGLGSYGKVEYRIDDNPARTKDFKEATNNQALGLWRGNSSIPMIKELFGGKNLLVRFTPYGESAVTANFNIEKIEAAITPLRKACNW